MSICQVIPRPTNFVCQDLVSTTTTTKITTTTSSLVTTSTQVPNYGMAQKPQELIACSSLSQIVCPKDYVIVLLSSDYAYTNRSDATTNCAYR